MHSKQKTLSPSIQVNHAMIVRVVRILSSIAEFIFQNYTKTSYPVAAVALSLLLMARPASTSEANRTTDFALNPDDPYTHGVHGVGVPVSCRHDYNVMLTDMTSQYDTVAMAVATTLMALVPTLLSFAPLPTAEIRSLLYFNTEIALLSAAMTLGLYNKGTSTLGKRNLRNAKEMLGARADVSDETHVPTLREIQGRYYDAEVDLGSDSAGETGEVEKGEVIFKTIQSMAIQGHKSRPRRIKIAVIIFLFCLLQITLFGILVRGLPMIDDIEFIWACPLQSLSYFTWWLGGTAVGSGLIRTSYSSSLFASSEVFKLTPLIDKGDHVIYPHAGCGKCSVDRKDPPKRGWAVALLVKDISHFVRWVFRIGDKITIFLAIKRLGIIFSRLLSRHAMVVVVRYSEKESPRSHPLFLTFLGYIQAVTLVFLTFLFGSAWNGTLFYTMAFVFGFLTVITGSRVLSLWICRWMEINLNMVVIEYEDDKERTDITKALLSMPGVLVESTTEGYKYAGGYRFDTDIDKDKCEGHEYIKGEAEAQPHEWRAIGIGFGMLGGAVVWVAAAVVFYIASVPANEPFFPGVAHIRKDSKTMGNYFYPSICVAVVLGFTIAFAFGVKVRTEFGALVIEEDIPRVQV